MNAATMPTDPALMQMIQDLRSDIRGVRDDLTRVREDVASLKTQLSTMPRCTEPNACIGLRDDVQDLREEVAEHRELVASVKGGWKTLLVLCSVCGTLGSIITFALSRLWK